MPVKVSALPCHSSCIPFQHTQSAAAGSPGTKLVCCAPQHAPHTATCSSDEALVPAPTTSTLACFCPFASHRAAVLAAYSERVPHLTMWLLSLSTCSSETSRRAVEGTPSSSICMKGTQACCARSRQVVVAAVQQSSGCGRKVSRQVSVAAGGGLLQEVNVTGTMQRLQPAADCQTWLMSCKGHRPLEHLRCCCRLHGCGTSNSPFSWQWAASAPRSIEHGWQGRTCLPIKGGHMGGTGCNAPPALSSSAPRGLQSFSPVPCTPCRRCPPQSFPASRKHPSCKQAFELEAGPEHEAEQG